MMRKQQEYLYFEDKATQVLAIPYSGSDDIFLFVILPTERFGLANVRNSMTGPTLLGQLDQLANQTVDVGFSAFF